MDIVIAGGGVSAFEAALAARKTAPDARVAVYSEGPMLSERIVKAFQTPRYTLS